MAFVFPPPQAVSLALAGSSDRFAVSRIFCVGQNYADHVREMGGDPARGTPIFFDKPATALVDTGSSLAFPLATQDLHFEVELAVALQSGGTDLDAQSAAQCIYGYACALDMTRRDMQAEAKKSGKPWDMAKGFDESAPCGPLVAMPGQVLDRGAIVLKVNGQTRQSGDLNQMIWGVEEIIMALSTLVTLRQGDLILTGTPAGVGPVVAGDHLTASIEGVGTLDVTYTPRAPT